MGVIKYEPLAVTLREEVTNAFRELINTYGKNNKPPLKPFRYYIISNPFASYMMISSVRLAYKFFHRVLFYSRQCPIFAS